MNVQQKLSSVSQKDNASDIAQARTIQILDLNLKSDPNHRKIPIYSKLFGKNCLKILQIIVQRLS
jgi:hypothetical protein